MKRAKFVGNLRHFVGLLLLLLLLDGSVTFDLSCSLLR